MQCKACKKEVEYPDFGPCTKKIGNHIVEAKTYVHGGSGNIQNIRDRRRYSPTVFLQADTQAITPSGQIVNTPPIFVQFSDARYVTENPQEQWLLENVAAKKFPIHWGEGAEEVWRKNQLTPEQQTVVARAELAEVERKVHEQNELLAQVKSRKAVGQ